MTGSQIQTVRDVRELLGRAYISDPLMAWIFPDARSRAAATAAWLGGFVEDYVQGGRVECVDDEGVNDGEPGGGELTGVALWRSPDDVLDHPGLPSIGEHLQLLVGPERAGTIGQALARLRPLRPQHPHSYLHFMAVRPDRQRRGVGTRLLESVMRGSSELGHGLHLETARPDGRRFYERNGFHVTGEVVIEAGPTLWTMHREP